METKIVTINLDARAYDIFIGHSLLFRIGDFIPQNLEGRNVFIVTDKNVEPYAARVRSLIADSGTGICDLKVLPAGEKTKSFKHAQEVCTWMLAGGTNRDSLVLAIGGGVIGDLTGFCASIVMRGVPYVQVPTTLLSQVDSSVGGKTGINTAEGKNLIGSFYQPTAVIADIETLETLPRRELLAGYAEVVKYGLIEDAGFFTWLETNGTRVCNLDQDAVSHVLEASCKAKARVVQADELEHGRRALLNLGHTFGHALESEAGYNGALLHGEAVSIGIVMAFDLSYRMGMCSQADVERVEQHLSAMGLPTRAAAIEDLNTSVDALVAAMGHDKKIKNGKLTFVLVSGIGEAFLSDDVASDLVRDVLRESLGGETKTTQKGIKERWKSAFSSL